MTKPQTIKRCEAEAKRGTGTGTCDRPLDQSGRCDRPDLHIEESK